MGHKKKRYVSPLSSDTESESSSNSSISQSQSCSSAEEILEKKLSKKDLKKIYKLEKMIQKQQRLLKKENQQRKQLNLKNKQEQIKQKKKREENAQLKNFKCDILQSKKLFITAIDSKYSRQEVNEQLRYALKSLEGVEGFRIKMKQGFATYAFVDFDSKSNAKVGIQKLRNKKLFGQKIAIYYSQDEQKDQNKIKKCFQCNETGHYAKQCMNNQAKGQIDNQQTNINRANLQETKKIKYDAEAGRNQQSTQQKQRNEMKSVRIVRDKNRLSRLINRE